MSNRKNLVLKGKKTKSPTRLVVVTPSKGLNNNTSSVFIDDREFSDSLNIQYDDSGIPRTRDGTITKATLRTNVVGMGVYTDANGIRTPILCDNGSGTPSFVQYTVANGLYSSMTKSSGFTLPAKNVWFTEAQGKVIAWDGSASQAGVVYTASAWSDPGTIPSAKFSVYYQNRHIAAGVLTQSNRLYLSNTTDSADFTVATGGTPPQPDNATDVPGATVFAGTPGGNEAAIIDVRKNDGDKITGLGIFQDQVIVFKERSIFSLTFDADGLPVITQITNATGCVSAASVRAVENDLFFLARDGLRSLGNEAQYFDAIRTSVISNAVRPLIDRIDDNKLDLCYGVYYNNRYYLTIPLTEGSSTRSIVVYDRRFKAFSYWDLPATHMVVGTDTINNQRFYMMNNSGAAASTYGFAGTRLFEISPTVSTDGGLTIPSAVTAISCYIDSKVQSFGSIDITKFFIDLGLIFKYIIGVVKVTLYDDLGTPLGITHIYSSSGDNTDGGLGIDMLGEGVLGNNSDNAPESTIQFFDSPVRVVINRQLRALKFRVETVGLGDKMALSGYVYAVFPNSHYLFDSSRKLYLDS